jgi:hypothetical protein
MKMLKPGGGYALLFALLALLVALPTVLTQEPPRSASTPAEMRAVQVSNAYIRSAERHRWAVDRTPSIEARFGYWKVSYFPSCSSTVGGGPMLSVLVDQGSFRVSETISEHALCDKKTRDWLAVAGAGDPRH